MKSRNLLSAIALGLGLTIVLLLLLARPTPVVRANPGIYYYVREGGTGNCLFATTPCSSVQYAINLAGDGDEASTPRTWSSPTASSYGEDGTSHSPCKAPSAPRPS